ncbi:WD repeat-containing protein WRAP73-like [Lepeophtheirus salmonis]|uniref:WD repeat-containing protein WRAP73-like n=1 Tax=Lepeophtheirus salmonis TaxID=72036 RepID=UPI003AF37599
MNFSSSFPCMNGLVSWSPNGLYLLSATANRLILRDSSSLKVISNYVSSESVDQLFWSPNSQLFGMNYNAGGVTRVFRVNDPDWNAKISEGSFLKVIHSFFSPDSSSVLTLSEFNLRLSIWNLTGLNKSVPFIKFPKNLDLISFSKQFLAVVESKGQEILSIYDSLEGWQILRSIELPSVNIVGLAWSPHDDVIALWESSLHYRILVYSIDGRCLLDYSAYNLALGIKSVSWDPSGKILAIGSFDAKIRLINALSWSVLTELFDHSSYLDSNDMDIYEENDVPLGDIDAEAAIELSSKVCGIETHMDVVSVRPAFLSTRKVNPSSVQASNKSLGIGDIKFSSSGRYLAAKNDACASALWVWDVQKLKLKGLIVLKRPGITSFEWEPHKPRLSIAGHNQTHYVWTPMGMVNARLPYEESEINIFTVKWNPLGKVVACVGTERFICCK